MSGLSVGGELKMLTLTSSPDAPADIQRSWRKLVMRLRRRGLCRDYIKVTEATSAGRPHLHLIVRSPFIEVAMISDMWRQVHKSPIVWITRVRKGQRSRRRTASYIAKYLSKDQAGKLSWSFRWVYPGFCNTWQKAKGMFSRVVPDFVKAKMFPLFLIIWHTHLKALSDPEIFLGTLQDRLATLAHLSPSCQRVASAG
jgi:hypothetical protein